MPLGGLHGRVVSDTTLDMKPHAQLKKWLTKTQVTPAEMARRCDYDRSNFHKLINGRLKPSLNLAVAIERETEGEIPVQAWAA